MPDVNRTLSDQETVNKFNFYFSTVFEIEADEPLQDFEDRSFAEPLEHFNITDKEVENVLVALKPDKSQGPDLFHPKNNKETKVLIKEPLKAFFFQKLLDEITYHQSGKKANVSAIFKKIRQLSTNKFDFSTL